MSFILDEDLPYPAAELARSRGLDVTSSYELGRNGLPDEEQLRLAATDHRCFVTRNAKDFYTLTFEFLEKGWPHSGVLAVPASIRNDDASAIASALVEYARAHPDGLPAYMVDYLRPAGRSR